MTTSETDLYNMAQQRGIDNFEVLAIDELAKHKKILSGSYIINSAPRSTGGKHWVSAFYSPKHKYIHLFDSFGMPPDPRLVKWLKSSGKEILTNTGHLQDIKEATCGLWCIEFLEYMNKGGTMIDFITE